MSKQVNKIILYVVLVLGIFLALEDLTGINPRYIQPKDGVADLGGIDLSREVVHIAESGWEQYPNQLLDPAELAGVDSIPATGKPGVDYGTFRLRVILPPGRVYSITGKSFPFSQRVFVDGRLIDEVGRPGRTREDTIPHTFTYEYTFTASSETVELVFQAASFHHRQKVRNNPIRLGEPQVVGWFRTLAGIRTDLVIGCLMTAFLFFLGLFIFFSSRRYFLYLALACLAASIRAAFIGEKHAMDLFRNLDWVVAIRIEYLCLVVFVVFLLLYFDALYPAMLQRRFVAAIVGLSMLYGLVVLITDTLVFSGLLWVYSLVWAAACVWTLWQMVLQLKRGDVHTALIFSGLMVFAATAVYDELVYLFVRHVRTQHTLVAGVLVCVFMNMVALTLGFSETERALNEARVRQHELHESNRLLDRLNLMKVQFMANISHELKTPLTVMSTHAQLSIALLETRAFDDEIRQSLDTIVQESNRLARMVTGMLDLVGYQETQNSMEILDIGVLLSKCVEAFRAIFERKGTAITLDLAEGLPAVRGNTDMLTQVMFNLLSNADRYAESGVVRVGAEYTGRMVEVTVADDGPGFSPTILSTIFERQMHLDGEGAGLGLSICRAIVDLHGGRIAARNGHQGGAVITFTLTAVSKGNA